MRVRDRGLVVVALAALITSGCSRKAEEPPASEPPSLDVTHWTDKSELFMEYPPLVAGQSALFAVHLTRLADFTPVTAGQARVEFTPAGGGQPTVLVGPQPSRPGAFRVEGPPPAAGRYRWALVLNAPDLSDRHDLGEIQVFADRPSAIAEAEKRPAEDPAAIGYLKEQQWTNEFATAAAQQADVRSSIRVPAVLDALPGGEAVVAAPAAGRLVAERLPSIGDEVRAGAVLARLEPRLGAATDRTTLAAEVAEAQTTLEAARAEQTRAERLLADRAVPARRVEDAKRGTAIAEMRLAAAQARLSQRDETLRTGGGAAAGNAFTLRAPIGGRITDVLATLGAAYEEGASLFKIARIDALELKVFIPAAETAWVRNIAAVSLEVPGRADPFVLRFHHVHHPGVLDQQTKALPVQMEVQNPDRQLLIGQSGTATLYTGAQQRLLTVPKAAVLMEAGRPYVFVQIGGESFARRFIDIATRDGDLVAIKSGVQPGERVVTRGAYEVQLASAARGLPAEGHVH
jgi:cobalt-zinc-cadmium efflux system membrane fusion protein